MPVGCAHWGQNRAAGGSVVPQRAHARWSGEPHSAQNFAPGGCSLPHRRQGMAGYRPRYSSSDQSFGGVPERPSFDQRAAIDSYTERRSLVRRENCLMYRCSMHALIRALEP